ncbi:pyridoxamine 5'-phosphate oxidase [Haematobacter missouriensis]|uniref:Pyridoxine/pyridoxamine 5'-phosphate oxidase n=1 Tax=Haematobacter missouriensis TaxID=366616 RepID=A0A212AJP5_9RHOB|nr:pyridoxamine 5'-phosphate oxidase [Haematobacter missouriensis]KFI32553.1 pyridoxamine 5'-phosphate oxidase [Haematobacter missouriensis]OWJ70212.1 pyridoxamine 5'-phosphate oxidase [Haematobacter missouriensis]OWJ81720.1 pyridoxamine 5'-phosphate oxidase [Haematobacter missouriensis]
MTDRNGIFAGEDPFAIARRWLAEAEATEPNDPNAIALATVDAEGLPDVRMVLLKEIGEDRFTFYTNYGSAKAQEIEATGKAAFVLHWKSLRRQVRVRGRVVRNDGAAADAYFASRSLQSRLGAWASQQSQPLESRGKLMAEVAKITTRLGPRPPRPEFWGGYDIFPSQMEFWADGAFRLHDRYRWSRAEMEGDWEIQRLYP